MNIYSSAVCHLKKKIQLYMTFINDLIIASTVHMVAMLMAAICIYAYIYIYAEIYFSAASNLS